MRQINIAITINLQASNDQSIWVNGGNQHCVFLYFLLKTLPEVENVWLVSDIDGSQVSPHMYLDAVKGDIYRTNTVIDRTDLLIEMSTTISQEFANIVWRRGGKVISYRFGNDYVISAESCSLGSHGDWVMNRNSIFFDEVWTNPQHERTCKSFFEHTLKAPVHILSHLWSPYFVDQARARNTETSGGWGYRDRGTKKTIGIFEPNINVVKSAIIPMYASAKFADDYPDQLSRIYMTNTLKLATHPLFTSFVNSTAAGRAGIASAEDRYPFIDYAAKYVDIVVCHQWENGLNYHYYEALHGSYPLVHNSPFLKDVGYYYPDFDIDAAAVAIHDAATNHDDNIEQYKLDAQATLEKVNPFAPKVIDEYRQRLQALMGD